MERRNFLRKTGLGLGALATPYSFLEASSRISYPDPPKSGSGELDWESVRKAFDPNPDFINLENGYFSPQTREGYDRFVEYGRVLNQNTSKVMRGEMEDETDETRRALAEFSGTSFEEVVITRNTTESLNIIINGIDLERGDEIVITDQDYPNMINAIRQREKREGIVVREIRLPLNPKSDEEIVEKYEAVMSARTKLVLVTHMINLTGQILPCRKIADMVHSKGAEVIVDAAHSYAHVDFKIPELGGDYVGTSLHKWLSAPVGSGLLYVRKDKIEKVWPLMGDTENDPTNIRKFQRQGTQPIGTRKAIRDSIEFHKRIGGKRKEEKLRSMTRYWTDEARKMNNIGVNTPEDPSRYAALGNFFVKGANPGPVSKKLFSDYKIMTVPIKTDSVTGIRVTPQLYNQPDDLDKLIAAIKTF